MHNENEARPAGRPGWTVPVIAASAVTTLVIAVTAGCSSSGGHQPSSASATTSSSFGGATVSVGALRITGGYIPEPASTDVAAAYLTITNTGSTPDRVTAVTSNVAKSVMAMNETSTGTTGSMTDLARVTVPAHGAVQLRPNHAHLMLEHPVRTLKAGQRVSMTIVFARAGKVVVTLPVVPITGPPTTFTNTSATTGMTMSR